MISAALGANYATTEFLLSGLPIVSTPSRGGREVWFTDFNSILSDPTCQSVAQAVGEWRRRCMEGQVDRDRIRMDCVTRIRNHRERYIAALQDLLDQEGVCASARQIFDAERDQDRLLHSLSFKPAEAPGRHPYCGGNGWYALSDLPPPLSPLHR
jgi:hypothetical protein